MNRRQFLLGSLALPHALSGCLFDGPLKHDFGVTPEPLGDGWAVATPESVGLSSVTLADVHASLLREDRFPGSLGMLVVKDAKLVFETYLRSPSDRDHVHHVQSVTKSIVSTCLQLARDRGFFPSLDVTLGALLPEHLQGRDPLKANITLRHLLTMKSGIAFDNESFDLEMWTEHHDDPLGYLLDKPLVARPGDLFSYRNVDPQLLIYAIERATGQRVRDLARTELFEPMGITDFYWDSGPDDFVTIGGNGLHLRPRDLAKIGQTILDGGSWQTNEILSKGGIAEMTSVQATSDTPDAAGNPYPYGFYWWLFPEGFAGWGTGGQFLVVDPARRIVIVHVALPNTVAMDGSTLDDFRALVAPILA